MEPRAFWNHVDQSGECWIWTGKTVTGGYGQARWCGKYYRAHRLSWQLAHGRKPALTIDHLCRNRLCVRPDHLEEVTQRENVHRGLLGDLRTHCKHGHELTPENRVPWSGHRQCLTCRREITRRYKARKAAEAA